MSKERDHGLIKRIGIDIAGFSMIIASPFLGWLPGPGGIPLFLAGLGVLSLNYEWPERILKDFDKRRIELTEKYLVKNRTVSVIIDLFGIGLIAVAIYLVTQQDSLVLRAVGVGMTTLSLILILSNQRRVDKIMDKLKRNKE